VHHVVLGHVTADPADFPDEWARAVAEEVTVNEFVREPLPKGAITLAHFPRLPPLESTGRRYDRLRRVRGRQPIAGPPAPPTLDGGGPEGAASAQDGQRGDGGFLAAGRGRAGRQERGASRAAGNGGLNTVDDHRVWQQAHQDLKAARAAVRAAVEQAALEVGRDQLPVELRDAVEALGVGTLPGSAHDSLRGDGRGRRDWRRLLRLHVGRALEMRPVFSRPPRRFPGWVGVLPARRRRLSAPRILAVVDTSGSITTALLEQISAELARLATHFAVQVVEADADVQRVYDFRPVKCVYGRGGTDFRPALDPQFLRRRRPDVVVYFTDGLGPAPAKAPHTAVIWCLVPGGQAPADWGRVIRIGQD
jgi:hypothetical protein